MESIEMGRQAYTDLRMSNALLDCEMQTLQSNIKYKTEENTKLVNAIADHRNKIYRLAKEVKDAQEREQKVKNNIYDLRNTRSITEGLLMSLKHQLVVCQKTWNETKVFRKNIIQKYSDRFQSHSVIYKSLPWIQKSDELKTNLNLRKIQLKMMKLQYSSYKQKEVLFNKIQDHRVQVAVINLAKYICERNATLKEIETINEKSIDLKAKIKHLSNQKMVLLERIDQKVKEAVAEARERVVKAHVADNVTKLNTNERVMLSSKAAPLESKESIYSMLGISAPVSLKRPATSRISIAEKLPRLFHLPNHPETNLKQSAKALSAKKIDTGEEIVARKQVAKPIDHLTTIHTVPKLPDVQVDSVNSLISNSTNIDINISNNDNQEESRMKKKMKKTQKHVTFIPDDVTVSEKKPLVNEITKRVEEPVEKPLEDITPKQSSNEVLINQNIVTDLTPCISPMIDLPQDVNSPVPTEGSPMGDISLRIESPDLFVQKQPLHGYCFSPPLSPAITNSPPADKSEKDDKPEEFSSSLFSPMFPGNTQKSAGGPANPFGDFFGSKSPKKGGAKTFFQLFD